ncbi:hypothetical protein Gotur_019844 [Gossypium turneri]
MSSNEGGLDKAKLFSSKELEIATDQYNENRILGCGGQGMVYKGMLSDGRIVAVKKSKTVNEGYLEQFINEIFILSQIDHSLCRRWKKTICWILLMLKLERTVKRMK